MTRKTCWIAPKIFPWMDAKTGKMMKDTLISIVKRNE